MVSRPHWRVEFDIELNFGKPELEAVLKWQVDVRLFLLEMLYFSLRWRADHVLSGKDETVCAFQYIQIITRSNLLLRGPAMVIHNKGGNWPTFFGLALVRQMYWL